MTRRAAAHVAPLLGALLACGCRATPPWSAPGADPRLELVASVATADGAGAEVVSVARRRPLAAVCNGVAGTVELFDLRDPRAPRPVAHHGLGLAAGEQVTSVALTPDGARFLVAVVAADPLARGAVQVHACEDGARTDRWEVGVHPDCVVCAPDGRHALVANEAEGYVARPDGALASAPGSLSLLGLRDDGTIEEHREFTLVDLSAVAGVTRPEHGRTLERVVDGEARTIPFEGGRPAELEPEAIAFSPDGRFGFVTLQENNAVAVVDVAARRVARVHGLGTTRHAADLADDGRVAFDEELVALREPDGIAVTPDGAAFVTADEGDTTPEASRTLPGRPAGGGRTLSVFDAATGALLGDTGDALDRAAHAAALYPDGRSGTKGSEPEMLTVFGLGRRTYAAVGLERANAVALVDLTDRSSPRVLGVTSSGAGAQGPEGVAHFVARDGETYVLAANEVSGRLAVFGVVR